MEKSGKSQNASESSNLRIQVKNAKNTNILDMASMTLMLCG